MIAEESRKPTSSPRTSVPSNYSPRHGRMSSTNRDPASSPPRAARLRSACRSPSSCDARPEYPARQNTESSRDDRARVFPGGTTSAAPPPPPPTCEKRQPGRSFEQQRQAQHLLIKSGRALHVLRDDGNLSQP